METSATYKGDICSGCQKRFFQMQSPDLAKFWATADFTKSGLSLDQV